MGKNKRKHNKGTGLAPGTLIYTGEKGGNPVRISMFDYNGEKLVEEDVSDVDQCAHLKSSPSITWLNIDGVHNLPLVQKTGELFGIHPLVLEDIVNTDQRPKCEDFDQYLFVVVKMAEVMPQNAGIKYEQLSMVVAERFLISFQEDEGDVFSSIRHRIRNPQGRIRNRGSDYLGYVLVDSVVDHYFVIIDYLEQKISALDDQLSVAVSMDIIDQIHILKREVLHFRKTVFPVREVLHQLGSEDISIVTDQTRLFLRDVHDHVVHVIELVDIQRETLTTMAEYCLSQLNSRMNEVMKTLTIVSSIFIPLTFIVGVYGMNFRHLPEVDWYYGYYFVWGLMLSIAGTLIVWFRKKKWL